MYNKFHKKPPRKGLQIGKSYRLYMPRVGGLIRIHIDKILENPVHKLRDARLVVYRYWSTRWGCWQWNTDMYCTICDYNDWAYDLKIPAPTPPSTITEVINYIENDAEIPIPINKMFNEEGGHITKKQYGLVLLKQLCVELKNKFLKQK